MSSPNARGGCRSLSWFRCGVIALAVLAVAEVARGQGPEAAWVWAGGLAGWSLDHDLALEGEQGSDGVRLRATGGDPYLSSPVFDLVSAEPVEMEVTLRVDGATTAQVFWTEAADRGFREAASARFAVPRGERTTVVVPLVGREAWPGRLARLRIDPGDGPGAVEIVSVALRPGWRAELRRDPKEPRELVFEASVHVPRAAGEPQEVRLLLDDALAVLEGPGRPALEPIPPGAGRELRWRLRSRAGGVRVVDLAVGGRRLRRAVVLPEPVRLPQEAAEWTAVASGPATVEISQRHCGLMRLRLRRGTEEPELFGLVTMPHLVLGPGDGPPVSLTVTDLEPRLAEISGGIQVRGEAILAADLRVQISLIVTAGALPGVFELGAGLSVSAPCDLVHWMPLAVLPGVGSFGPRHRQALFPGLEYLDADEESSSDKDDRTPAHVRFLPDPLKVTIPLMVLAHDGRHAALGFSPDGLASPVFSVPDRLLERGGSLLGLVVPAVGQGRGENELLAEAPLALDPERPLLARATLVTGEGADVTAALRTWLQLRPRPLRPERPRPPADERIFLARSLLDSALYDPARNGYGHCVEANWSREPSADLAGLMLRLALDTDDAVLAARLRERAQAQLAAVPPERHAIVSRTHAFVRAAPFLAGGVEPALRGLERPPDRLAWEAIEKRLHFRGPLAETHFEDTAVGLGAAVALDLLEVARFTGQAEALAAARRVLDGLQRFDGQVPRGAQTWEVPLHTPDILASARAVQAFTIAFELEGRAEDLARARAWAWSGVPFVYLWGRPDLAVMRYATIPVFGATNYEAPNWIGLPVQWCGLSYAEGLYRLARHDPDGPWKDLADGILVAAEQMLVPEGPAAGCLPDSFALAAQERRGPMINPGSVLALLPELEGRPPLLDFARFTGSGVWVHAPGKITITADDRDRFAFRFEPPGPGRFEVAVVRCGRDPAGITVAGRALQRGGAEEQGPGWNRAAGRDWLILRVAEPGEIVVDLGP